MPLTDKQRAEIVTEAFDWVGTKYVGWSCLKHTGCDCCGLLFGVYRDLGYVPEGEKLPTDYSLQAAQHTTSTEYVEFIQRYMREITPDDVKVGDVIAFQIGLGFAHGGIVVELPYTVIHALAGSGVRAADALKHPALYKAKRRYFTLQDSFCAREKDIDRIIEKNIDKDKKK